MNRCAWSLPSVRSRRRSPCVWWTPSPPTRRGGSRRSAPPRSCRYAHDYPGRREADASRGRLARHRWTTHTLLRRKYGSPRVAVAYSAEGGSAHMGPGYELRTPQIVPVGLPQSSFLTRRVDRFARRCPWLALTTLRRRISYRPEGPGDAARRLGDSTHCRPC